jgi:hypothetical protein
MDDARWAKAQSLRTGGKFVVGRFSGPSDVLITEGVLITAGCDDVWTMLDGLKPHHYEQVGSL